jgi:hypothetical protein
MSARKSDLSAKSDLNGRRPPPKGYRILAMLVTQFGAGGRLDAT